MQSTSRTQFVIPRRTATRCWMALAVCGWLVAGLPALVERSVAAEEPAASAPARPNIVLIMTDDQGYGEMSCHGNPILKTPNLDRLHRESVRFTDFHVSPTCAPTRTSLMTGRHEFRSGVTHTIFERERMSLKATTLAQYLQRAGYRNGIFGKWHLGDEDAYLPDRRGFDEVFIHGAGGIGQTYPGSGGDAPNNRYFDPAIWHNGKFEKTSGFCTDVFFRQALAWIDSQRKANQPFFVYLTPNAPHGPYHCPKEYQDRFAGQELSQDAIGYYGMIANIDDNVGRLLDQLRDWQLERQTLVIFLTDNGHAIGKLYNAGMRGAKGTPYQGGTRVPSFWRWPGVLPAGVDVPALAAHVDILPTLAEIVGAKLPDQPKLDGRSLLPLLKDRSAPWPDRLLFTHVGRWERGQAESAKFANCAVRNARFRFVNNRELFDVLADPGETKNVIEQHPETVAALRAAYDQWWSEILPALENENLDGPAENPFKTRYWKQFGGRPEPKPKAPEPPCSVLSCSPDSSQVFSCSPISSSPLSTVASTTSHSGPRPNILWLTSEDHGPHVGCYGDAYATTPRFDELARRGVRYRRVWSNAPVCAPARTTLITGMYPPSLGAEHMRSMVPLPAQVKLLPQLLRDAGYYCTNNAKEDYNVEPHGRPWDESSKKAHWSGRAANQPFFAVFNSEASHESRLRTRPHQAVHDPARVRIPAYHPDTPEVRQDWAQYYDQITVADAAAGARLAELEQAGLADDTIVFYFSDHGSGMPRNKRWLYDAGLRVPLVIYIPEKFRHLASADHLAGEWSERLVSFVDFAPTVLSLAGVKPPAWQQGVAFLGPHAGPPREYVFGFRARMDERHDLSRSVTDGRFVYIRNYLPHKPQGQYLDYMFQTPTTKVWNRLHGAGQLNSAQDAFWRAKPYEELYDSQTDPDEVTNLAAATEHLATKERLATAMNVWERDIRDVSFLPEGEMHRRAAGRAPRDLALAATEYDFDSVFETARMAARRAADDEPALRARFADSKLDAGTRYWAALGLGLLGHEAVARNAELLQAALRDPAPDVQVAAAEALARFGSAELARAALDHLAVRASWEQNDAFTSRAALDAFENLDELARGRWDELARLPTTGQVPHARYRDYVPRLVERFRQRSLASSP